MVRLLLWGCSELGAEWPAKAAITVFHSEDTRLYSPREDGKSAHNGVITSVVLFGFRRAGIRKKVGIGRTIRVL